MPRTKTPAERVAKYAAIRKNKGFIRVSVWVKKEDREKVIEYAERLRGEK